jgi:hypothetical protein
LPCAFFLSAICHAFFVAHGKLLFPPSAVTVVCNCYKLDIFLLPLLCVRIESTTNIYVCRAFRMAHNNSFLFLHYKNIILNSIFQIHTRLHMFTIFNNYLSFKEFFRIRQILTAST